MIYDHVGFHVKVLATNPIPPSPIACPAWAMNRECPASPFLTSGVNTLSWAKPNHLQLLFGDGGALPHSSSRATPVATTMPLQPAPPHPEGFVLVHPPLVRPHPPLLPQNFVMHTVH